MLNFSRQPALQIIFTALSTGLNSCKCSSIPWQNGARNLVLASFFQEWQNHLAFKENLVRIEDSQKTSIIGIEKGINSRGNLVLILGDGQEKEIVAGDVHLRPVEQR